MDSSEIIREIDSRGLEVVSDIIKNKMALASFSAALRESGVKDAILKAILIAGEKAQKTSRFPLFLVLGDRNYSMLLRDLMIMPECAAILREAVKEARGEFLILGAMHVNYPTAHSFVNLLLQKKEGRRLVVALVCAAAMNHGKPIGPGLPPLSEAGKKFHATLQDIKKLEKAVSEPAEREKLMDYLNKNEVEAAAVISGALCDDAWLKNLVRLLQTEKGREFCALIGKSGFGRRIGAGRLWPTKGGRVFVHEMLKTDEGAYAIYAIMTGMSVGEFVAYTARLEGD